MKERAISDFSKIGNSKGLEQVDEQVQLLVRSYIFIELKRLLFLRICVAEETQASEN